MLVTLKCFGTGLNATLYVDVTPTSTVQELCSLVGKFRPDIEIKRLLFAGKQLSDPNSTLESYDVYKECIIQLFGRLLKAEELKQIEEAKIQESKEKFPESEAEDEVILKPPIHRHKTTVELAFGDIILVTLIGARNLVRGNLTGKSDPYVIFIAGDQTCKSSVIKSTVDPQWNEQFGFILRGNSFHDDEKELAKRGKTPLKRRKSKWVKKSVSMLRMTQDQYVSVLCFDHDFFTPDEPLGQFEINVDNIPRDKPLEKYFRLEGVPKGEIMLSIRRAALTSPDLSKVATELCSLERPWTQADYDKAGVTANMLLGLEPFNHDPGKSGKIVNPALNTLENLLSKRTLKMDNQSTLYKVFKILESQKVVLTQDLPSRHLWIHGLKMDESRTYEKIQAFSEGAMKRFFYVRGFEFSSAFVSFRSCEVAVRVMLSLFQQNFGTIGFGRNLKLESPEVQSIHSGFFMMDDGQPVKDDFGLGESQDSKNRNTTWRTRWFVLSYANNFLSLRIYRRLQDAEPLMVIPANLCLFLKTGPWGVEIVDKVAKMSYKVRAVSTVSTEEIEAWTSTFREVRKFYASAEDGKDNLDVSSMAPKVENPEKMRCHMCGKEKRIHDCYALDEMVDSRNKGGSFACVACLAEQVISRINTSEFAQITQHYSIQDLQDVMSDQQFQSYLDASISSFLGSSAPGQFVKCPKCDVAMELTFGQSADLMGQELKGLDNRPLRPDAMKHYLGSRLRCRTPGCYTDFCAECRRTPYHIGFNCQEFVEFQSAPKCRFCNAPVMAATKFKTLNPAFANVCTAAECVAKVPKTCDKKLNCGHYCFGYRGEIQCPPCLVDGCKERNSGLPTKDDSCGICLSEELGHAPYILLKCGHGFHRDCIDARLEKGYTGARITFDFARCPLCKVDIDHPDLQGSLKPIRLLETEISQKALERLKYEGLDKEEEIVDPNGRFYNNPVGYAMDHFSFYKCHECRKPYFAGARECGPAGGDEDHPEDDPAELICASCSNVSSFELCATHGADWISFKCKFCCTIASFHCWGNTHFCINCHNPGIWDKLSKFKTGENLKPIEDYSQCPGVREKIDQFLKENPRATAAQKYEAFSKIYSDPARCPLKLRHLPSGFEFGMGCTMCADSHTEEENKKAAEKAKKEEKENRDLIKQAWDFIEDNMQFNYVSDFDENGIIHYIGSAGKTRPWLNPAARELKIVVVKSCELMKDSEPAMAWIGRKTVRCVTRNLMNSWFSVDFLDHTVQPTHYSLRHYSSWDTEALRNWVLEASNDEKAWSVIDVKNNDTSLASKGATKTFRISATAFFRIFRLRLTGLNSNNHYNLCCSGFELYGSVIKSKRQSEALEQVKVHEDEMKEDLKAKASLLDNSPLDFNYVSDLDTNGICYYLGTRMGTQEWRNPMELGYVSVEASSLLADSEHPSAIVGRSAVRCVTKNAPGSFFIIDFKDFAVFPTHYTVRHYSSWNVEALRNWVFEGSNDKNNWEILKTHVNDQAIQEKGQCYSSRLDLQEPKAYRYFRLRVTGINSNKHFNLACSGFEVYGKLFKDGAQAKNVGVKQEQRLEKMVAVVEQEVGSFKESREFIYGSDFDTNGVLYFLGTAMGAIEWINPASIDAVRVSSSALMGDSAHIMAFVGRETVRLCSKAVVNSWFAVDLIDKYLTPTHYTLRHYSSWDTEALRDWVLEGSVNGKDFLILSKHVKDTALRKKGATHTWKIPGTDLKFRVFRLRITDKNSNDHFYLCCSGIELYGKLHYN